MTGTEDMVEARIYYLERTDTVVSVERSEGLASGVWWVQQLIDTSIGWVWKDIAVCDSLRTVADLLRPDQPTLLLEELW